MNEFINNHIGACKAAPGFAGGAKAAPVLTGNPQSFAIYFQKFVDSAKGICKALEIQELNCDKAVLHCNLLHPFMFENIGRLTTLTKCCKLPTLTISEPTNLF